MLSWIWGCVRGRKNNEDCRKMRNKNTGSFKGAANDQELSTWGNKQRRKENNAPCISNMMSSVTIFQLFSQSPPRGHRFSPSFATLSITRTKYWPVNWNNKRTHNKDSGLQARMWTDAWCSGRPWWPKILEPLIHSSKPAMKTAVVNHPNTHPFRKTWPQSGICKRVWREMSVFENAVNQRSRVRG